MGLGGGAKCVTEAFLASTSAAASEPVAVTATVTGFADDRLRRTSGAERARHEPPATWS